MSDSSGQRIVTRAHQSLAGPLGLGDVADRGQVAQPLVAVDRTERDFHRKLRTIEPLTDQALTGDPHRPHMRLSHVTRTVIAMAIARGRGNELLDRDSLQAARPITEQAFGLRIGLHDPPVAVDDDQRVRNGLEQPRKQRAFAHALRTSAANR
nr:hypothetical protein [Lysobacter antibioticus]